MGTRIRKSVNVMRKQPQQARSRATVDAIIEAGAQVLGRGGWNGFNTNRIANVAGVSIGTVYQYFSNKLALVEAIRQRHFEQVVAVVRLATNEAKSSTERVDALVGGLIEVHGASPALHRALLEDAPRSARTAAAEAEFERAYLGAYRQFMVLGMARGFASHEETSVRVLSSAIEGVVHDAARRGALTSRALRGELKSFILGYLG